MTSYAINIQDLVALATEEYLESGKGYYMPDLCSINALVNKHVAYKDLNLEIVGGTLSLDGWEEYGGSNRKSLQDWLKNHTDIHYWLEDKEGNVYDFLFEHFNYCAKKHNKYCKFPNIELQGVPKNVIEQKYKIKYIPTSKIISKVLFKKMVGVDMDK